MNREYNVTVSGSSYNATMRLHYEDTELNGSSESGIELWKYSTSWATQHKTANSTADNWVEMNNLSDIAGRWTLAEFVKVARWTGASNSAWGNSSNWIAVIGSPSLPPSSTDIAEIGDSSFTNQPTISSIVNIRSIQFGSAQAATLTISSGSLTTTGNIEGSWNTDRTHTIDVGNSTLTIGGSILLGDGTANHTLHLSLGSGTVNVNGSLTQTSSSNIIFSGAGQLNIGGDFQYVSGTFTSSTGTVTYNGSAAQIVAPLTYRNLTINKGSGTASLSSPATITNDLNVLAGTFSTTANIVASGNIIISPGATLIGGSATISLGGNWQNSGTYSSGTGTINLNGGGAQSITSTVFNNLSINKGAGTATPSANLTINGNLSITAGTLDLSSFTAHRSVLGGTLSLSSGAQLLVSGANNFPANFAVHSLHSGSTVDYNGTIVQNINAVPYGNLTLSNGATNAKILTGNTTINGNLIITNGATLNAGSSTLTLQGDLTNNGTFNPSTSSVQLNGSSQTIHGAITFNALTIGGNYTATNGITINGAFTNSGTLSTGSTTLIFSGNVSNNGTLTNSGTVTFTGAGSQSISLNNGFLSTGTVNFNGAIAPSFSDGSAPKLSTVSINNTGGITPSLGWIVDGAFVVANGAVFDGGSFNQTFYGAFINNGTIASNGTLVISPSTSTTITLQGTSFTSSGILEITGTGAITLASGIPTINDLVISNTNAAGLRLVNNWTINGDLTVQENATLNAGTGLSHTIAGNFDCNGTFNGESSTIIFNNTSNKNISANGTALFNHLTIANSDSVTVVSNISITGNLTNNGTMVNDGVVLSFTGSSNGTITTSGSGFPIDQLTVAKTSATVTLAVNVSNLTELTISSGTLDQSTFSISENGTDGGELTITSGAALKIAGTNGLATFTNGYTIASSGTVEFSGASQTIDATPVYGNLTISTAGTKTAGNDLTIAGNFSLTTGTFAAGTYTHTVAGNWTMSSGSLTGNNTITFNGTGTQTVSSTGGFYNVTINKSSGALSLSSDITVNSTLTLSSGNIVTNSSTVILSSLTGAVTRTSGHIIGNLQKNVATGATSRTFEVGDATAYAPVSVAFANVTIAGNLKASTTQNDHSSIVNSGINPSKSVNRFWTMSNSGIIFTTYSATFNYVSGDIDAGATPANFNVSKLTTGTWSIQTIGTRTGLTTQASGITAFGDFVIGESGKLWNGSSSNNWNDAANWTPSGVPTALDAITVGSATTININTAAVSSDVTIGNSSVTVTIVTGNSLTVSGNLVITAGTLNTESSFPTVSGTTTISGGTIGYTGTGAQTVKALNYSNLTISGSHVANNVTLESGTIKVSGTFTNTASFTSGSFVTTGNTLEFNGSSAQTIPSFTYQNLVISGGRANDTVTFASSGTIAVAGTLSLTATSVAYKSSGSTVDFNGSGAQTIPAFSYHHLTISGARSSNTITFAADSVHIAGAFTPSASNVTYSQTGTIFDFNGTSPQTIPAFTFNSLVFSNSGMKTISSSIVSNNNFVNRTASSITIDTGMTVQINGVVNNAGTIINNGTVKAGI